MAVKSLLQSQSHVELHSKIYQLPTRPTVVVCVNGIDPECFEHGMADGIIPNLATLAEQGFLAPATTATPSFAKPNNVSITTGQPVSAHVTVCDYFLDRGIGKEVSITDDILRRGSAILELMSKRGVRVAAVTAKDKLRAVLSHGLHDAICFSAERAASSCLQHNGVLVDVEDWLGQKQPSQYSDKLSFYVLDSGVKLLEEDRADLFYLVLSDYIQHKHAPGSKDSNAFLSALDERIGKLVQLGAQIVVTGNHGMSENSGSNGN